jgi:hypothetical protein
MQKPTLQIVLDVDVMGVLVAQGHADPRDSVSLPRRADLLNHLLRHYLPCDIVWKRLARRQIENDDSEHAEVVPAASRLTV